MTRKTEDGKGIERAIEYLTIAPALGGMIMAAGVFVFQFSVWWRTGQWESAPMAGYVPQELVAWAVSKQGGLLALKRVVVTILDLHASLCFFVAGWVCTIFLYELTKQRS